MSAAVVTDLYAAIAARDGEAVAAIAAEHFAEDVVLHEPPSLPWGGTHEGPRRAAGMGGARFRRASTLAGPVPRLAARQRAAPARARPAGDREVVGRRVAGGDHARGRRHQLLRRPRGGLPHRRAPAPPQSRR